MHPTPCGKDDWTYRTENDEACGWIGRFPYDRCLVETGAKAHCKESCCGILATMPPAGLCKDDYTWQVDDITPRRGCGWVKDDPEDRCGNEGAKEACCACINVEVHSSSDDDDRKV